MTSQTRAFPGRGLPHLPRLYGLPAAATTSTGHPCPPVPALRHPGASEHQLDAVVCALTAQMRREGRTRSVGDPAEGLVVIPELP